MKLFIPVLISFVVGAGTIAFTFYEIKRAKSKTLYSLLHVVLSLNIIWYISLFSQFFAVQKTAQEMLFVEIMLSGCIFICRFYFLYSFYKLTETILNQDFLSPIIKPFKITVAILSSVYLLAWAEPFLYNTKSITNTLMIYTDIMVFGLVMGGSVFLLQQAKQYKNIHQKRVVSLLGFVFLIPMTLAVLKWILGNTNLMSDAVIERASIHLFITVFNLLTLIWMLTSGKKIRKIETIEKEYSPEGFIKKYNITRREFDIIKQLSKGKTNKQIADTLFISIETVKDHNTNIYLKTGVKNRTQLTKLYMDSLKKQF